LFFLISRQQKARTSGGAGDKRFGSKYFVTEGRTWRPHKAFLFVACTEWLTVWRFCLRADVPVGRNVWLPSRLMTSSDVSKQVASYETSTRIRHFASQHRRRSPSKTEMNEGANRDQQSVLYTTNMDQIHINREKRLW